MICPYDLVKKELKMDNLYPFFEEKYSEHRFDLSDKEMEQVVDAVVNCATGRETANRISACVWDANHTCLSLEQGFDAKLFSTETGKSVASLGYQEQKSYIEKQNKYLELHPEWCSMILAAHERKKSFWRECCTIHNQRRLGPLGY